MDIENFKIKIKSLIKVCIDDLARNNVFFDSAKNRYELKSNKDYETIMLCDSAVIRIKQSKNNKTLELSKIYIDPFGLQNEVRFTKSELNWGKVPFDESVAEQILKNIEAVFKQCYMEGSVERFGCCSRYNECSDEKKCIHPDIKFAQGCIYKNNLENGRIFYGINRNMDNLPEGSN